MKIHTDQWKKQLTSGASNKIYYSPMIFTNGKSSVILKKELFTLYTQRYCMYKSNGMTLTYGNLIYYSVTENSLYMFIFEKKICNGQITL